MTTHYTDLLNVMAPAVDYVPVTKDDANDLPNGLCKGLLVGTPGTANLTTHNGTARDGIPLQAGFNPIRALRVRTGGTAADIVALY